MSKKLDAVIKKFNKELKDRKFFEHSNINCQGDFSGEYNFLQLSTDDGFHNFPIATVATENEAIAALQGYMAGLSHNKDKSYVKLCDKAY